MFIHYLKIALRNLSHNKVQTLFSIIGLSVAFLCFSFCAYVVRGRLTMDNYYPNHDRVLSLYAGGSGVTKKGLAELKQKFPEVEATFQYYIYNFAYYYNDENISEDRCAIACDTSLQLIYNPKLLAGNWEKAKNSVNSIVMCESTACELFGSPEQAIGQQIKSKYRSTTYTIYAVVEDLAYNNSITEFTHLGAWVLNDDNSRITTNPDYACNTTILLREGTDIQDFQERLKKAHIVGSSDHDRDRRGYKVNMPIRAKKPFDLNDRPDAYREITVIIVPGLLILLFALSNFFHLLLSNILLRRREYAMRRTHGAHTLDLWLMVSTQVILTLLAVGICTLLIEKFRAPLLSLQNMTIDGKEILWQSLQYIGILLLAGLLIAWIAVVRIRKDSLQEAMKTTTGRRPGRHIGRNLLLGVEMTISFLFLGILLPIVLQVQELEKDCFPNLTQQEKEEIITVPLFKPGMTPEEMLITNSELYQIEQDLKKIPSIQCYDKGNKDYFNQYRTHIKVKNIHGDIIETSTGEFHNEELKILNIKLFEGRMPENKLEVLVDKNFVNRHHLSTGDQLIVDRFLDCNGYTPFWFWRDSDTCRTKKITICGVIDNLSQYSKELSTFDDHLECIYYKNPKHGFNFKFRSYPGQKEVMCQEIKKVMQKYGLETQVLDHRASLAEQIQYYLREKYPWLPHLWLFTGISLALLLLGIYSAITTDTDSRRKEMAIRKINGAKTHHIAWMFCKLYIVLMIISACIVFGFLYIEDEPFLLFWLVVFLLMAIFVALTIGFKIWHIARVNPTEIIKEE